MVYNTRGLRGSVQKSGFAAIVYHFYRERQNIKLFFPEYIFFQRAQFISYNFFLDAIFVRMTIFELQRET